MTMSDRKDEQERARHDGWQDKVKKPKWAHRPCWGSGEHLKNPNAPSEKRKD